MLKDRRFYLILITSVIIVLVAASFILSAISVKRNQVIIDDTERKPTPQESIIRNLPKNDTTIIANNHYAYIKACKSKYKGTFLVLHGWNLPAEEWCQKTDLCSQAVKLGFCVVLPDMGLSIYQDQNFPETRANWLTHPTRSWLSDTLIPLLQHKFGLLLEADSNYIAGLSTGGRGVALVLLDLPKLFKGAAALSGDFDQTQLPNDNLCTAYYGAYATHKERWKTVDNPVNRIKEFNTPIFLGHGTNDKVVPLSQTMEFYDSLMKYHPTLKVELDTPYAGHNYEFWGDEVEKIIKFFNLK